MNLYKKLPSDMVKTNKKKRDKDGSFLESYIAKNVDRNRTKNCRDISRTVVPLNSVKKRALGDGKYTKKKRVGMSNNERKARGLFNPPTKDLSYASFVPLHRMWKQYMEDIIQVDMLNDKNVVANGDNLLKADYHGCLISVRRSKCPSYIGVSGIVIQETQNMFRVVTRENRVKGIPKAGSVFTFKLGQYCFSIHGNQFRVRSAERARRKFKHKANLEL